MKWRLRAVSAVLSETVLKWALYLDHATLQSLIHYVRAPDSGSISPDHPLIEEIIRQVVGSERKLIAADINLVIREAQS